MKRFHVHIAVADLPANIAFYSNLFGLPPSKQREDYAKWMLDNPRLNFAISSRGQASGLNHFGMQAEDPEELATLRQLADVASEGAALEQGKAACCYARSEKHWTVDPQGIAWEHFLTLSDAETFGQDTAEPSGACCIPLHGAESSNSQASGVCCVPGETKEADERCCN
ncbi:glyoxalase/bleomycin resistance/dioxygenase family protein [Alkalilimnicola ehrlichii]|uniref:Glyoxalase/bleomycin resistance/dioxygenase family protein n=1 Tax=Alkalilimnicola ehrlichii TaxID=351052 RepID=A0A3E0WJX3_9GAMM|nr:ArsI/CadI family heavy metal resistance metalloenzyme [Alkalilimnicola ehrlichii]RFA26268.1 glyoxalase/bleomycin resistance/dioxygenase family protein [Alkalilimnicola ehrlichii]RFA33254.1 glyoxalase/bleomycin resistance/dioxygenase family protein [Alkalilimnicola ehrlichii]